MDFLDRVARHKPRTLDAKRELKPAAVLLAIHRDNSDLLFVQRAEGMRRHSGQIGFPGGRIEAGETPFEAALREANEEVGLDPTIVQLLGALDPMESISDYLIHPFVALRGEQSNLEPDGVETESFFTVPVEYFLDPENCRLEVWSDRDRNREVYFWDYEGRTIWGVTGELLAGFFHVATGGDLAREARSAPSRQADFTRRFRR